MVQIALSSEPPSAKVLVERCALGDEHAWRLLYERNFSTARRFLRSMGVSPEHLDDACQEVFLQAYRHLPQFRKECSFTTWLYRLCMTEARRARRRSRISSIVHHWLGTHRTESTEGEMHDQKAATIVHAALDSLPHHERSVFVLYEFEGLSGRQIAEIARCPETTVFRRLHYARKAFRTYVLERGMSA